MAEHMADLKRGPDGLGEKVFAERHLHAAFVAPRDIVVCKMAGEFFSGKLKVALGKKRHD